MVLSIMVCINDIALCGLPPHICVLHKPSIWLKNSYMRLAKTTDGARRFIYVSHVNASLWSRNSYISYMRIYKRPTCMSFYLSCGESCLCRNVRWQFYWLSRQQLGLTVRLTSNRPVRKGIVLSIMVCININIYYIYLYTHIYIHIDIYNERIWLKNYSILESIRW